MIKQETLNKIGDRIGICASGLCLIHCLATPVLLIMFPATSDLFDSHIFHELFAIIVISSILVAVYPHCRRHGHKDIIASALIGVTLVVGSILLHDLPEAVHYGLTIVGSVFLLIAHIKNMKVRHGKCETEAACSGH